MKYKNHIDNYYYLLYGILFAMMLMLSALIVSIHANILLTVLGIIGILITLYYLYIFNNRYYEVTKSNLFIYVGFKKYKYRLKDIKKSYISRNKKHSYATSVKRICIEFKDGSSIYISPIRMEEVLIKIINNNERK